MAAAAYALSAGLLVAKEGLDEKAADDARQRMLKYLKSNANELGELKQLILELANKPPEQLNIVAANLSLVADALQTPPEKLDALLTRHADAITDRVKNLVSAWAQPYVEQLDRIEKQNQQLAADHVDIHKTVNARADGHDAKLDEVLTFTRTKHAAMAQEIEEVTKERDEAVEMAREGKAAGDPLATEAVAEYERNGDMAGRQRLLIERKKKLKADLLSLNRELAAVTCLRGDIDTAMATVKEILALDPDDLHGQTQLGHIHRLRGNLEGAERAYNRVLRVAKRHKDKSGQAAAYGNLGLIHLTRGEPDEASRMHKKALELQEQIGNREGMAAQYSGLGLIHLTRGELEQAEWMHKKALELHEQIGNREGMAADYGNLGLIHFTRGKLDEAEQMHKKAFELHEQIGNHEGMAADFGNLGLIHQARGELDKAERMLNKALKLHKQIGSREGMANQYGNLGLIHRIRGDLNKAERMHNKALELNEQIGNREGMATAYANLGLIHWRRGDLDEAERMLRKALELQERIGNREGMANDYANLGAIAKQRGDTDEARKLWTQSRDLYDKIGMPHMIKRIQGWLDELDGGAGGAGA